MESLSSCDLVVSHHSKNTEHSEALGISTRYDIELLGQVKHWKAIFLFSGWPEDMNKLVLVHC